MEKNMKRRPLVPSISIILYLVLSFVSCSSDVKGKYFIFQGTLQAQHKQTARAIEQFSQAALSGSKEIQLYAQYGMAAIYADMGESRAALALFESIIQTLVKDAGPSFGASRELLYRSYYNQGLCYYTLGDYDSAIQAFRSALRIDGSRWNAKRNLELSLMAKTKKNSSAASAGAVSVQKQPVQNPVLFDYIRQKEMDRWKSQQWKGSEDSSIDY